MPVTVTTIRMALANHEKYSFLYSDEYRRGSEEMAALIARIIMIETGNKDWMELYRELEKKGEETQNTHSI